MVHFIYMKSIPRKVPAGRFRVRWQYKKMVHLGWIWKPPALRKIPAQRLRVSWH